MRAAHMFGLASLLMCVTVNPCFAWGAFGHETASLIADRYLSDQARQRIETLIGDESLAEASTWADRMRSDPAPFWQKQAGPYHYVTVPRGERYDDIGPPPEGDALTALARFKEDLRNPQTGRARQQLALRFAIHIVQDLHQPLHTGNGTDRGGNDVRLRVNGEPSNFHRLWDRQILETAQRSQTQWLNYFERTGLLRAPTDADSAPLRWVAESGSLRESLYPAPRNISADYMRRNLPLAEKRLALAGIRTAAWLNSTLGESNGAHASDPAPAQLPWWKRLFRD